MKIIKQCIGIDISKDSFDCCIGNLNEKQEQSFSKSKSFPNNAEGFKNLLTWVKEFENTKEVVYVMEATGVYYEHLAYWLFEHQLKLSVLLPSKATHFARSHNIKTKTDSVDAQVLSRLGLERELKPWSVSSPLMREIKFLTREFRELKAKGIAVKNQLHAKTHSYQCPKSTEKRIKKQIKLIESQLLEIEAELRKLVSSDDDLAEKVKRLETIPGVSFMTVICILGETNAFALVGNTKQLVSYCGLDIKHNQSGNKTGKTKISKQGNSFIRNALYMPALCASQHNPSLRVFYLRLVERKPVKKIAVTAVARKLLIMMYVLWKNNTEYNPDYLVKNIAC